MALLCKETLELGKSVLIFCATKKVQKSHNSKSEVALMPVSDIQLGLQCFHSKWVVHVYPKTLF